MNHGLCVVPGCRITGQHLPTCEGDDCRGCLPRQADDGNACGRCAAWLRGQLDVIRDLALDARAVARGEVRRSSGGASGKPGSRPPLNDGATDALDAIGNRLGTWVRHVIEERGITGPTGSGDVLAACARFLAANLPWLVHRPELDEFAADVRDCASRIRGIVDGRAEMTFLGPCGALIQPQDGEQGDPRGAGTVECAGDVYGLRGAAKGKCRDCGTTVDANDRRAWLDGEVRQYAFTARDIADAYGVNVKTIRTWASRPRPDTGEPALRSYWRTITGLVAQWEEPPEGEERYRLHYVGDVLDLAAAEAARRETRRAERARKQQADTEGDAA